MVPVLYQCTGQHEDIVLASEQVAQHSSLGGSKYRRHIGVHQPIDMVRRTPAYRRDRYTEEVGAGRALHYPTHLVIFSTRSAPPTGRSHQPSVCVRGVDLLLPAPLAHARVPVFCRWPRDIVAKLSFPKGYSGRAR